MVDYVNYFEDDEMVKFHVESEDGTISEDIVLPRLIVNDIDASLEFIGENYDLVSPLNVIIFCALTIFFRFVEHSNLLNVVISYLRKHSGDDG